jgi:hypothetical protein
MKALLKIGFVAAFCFTGNAVFGQTPTPHMPQPANAKVKTIPASPDKKTETGASSAAPKAEKETRSVKIAPDKQRQKRVEPAKKEDIEKR